MPSPWCRSHRSSRLVTPSLLAATCAFAIVVPGVAGAQEGPATSAAGYTWEHSPSSRLTECAPQSMNQAGLMLCDPVVRATDGTSSYRPRISNGALAVPLQLKGATATYMRAMPYLLGHGEGAVGRAAPEAPAPAPLLVRWDNSGKIVGELMALPSDVPADQAARARAVSMNTRGDVLVVINYGQMRQERAFVWAAGGSVTELVHPHPAANFEGRHISDNGDVFGTENNLEGRRLTAFRAATTTWAELPTLPGLPFAEFVGASPNGVTVVANAWGYGSVRTQMTPMRIVGSTATNLSTPAFDRFGITTVLNDGTALSHAADADENYPTTLVTPQGKVNTGVDAVVPKGSEELSGTYGIADDGRILAFKRRVIDSPTTLGSGIAYGVLKPTQQVRSSAARQSTPPWPTSGPFPTLPTLPRPTLTRPTLPVPWPTVTSQRPTTRPPVPIPTEEPTAEPTTEAPLPTTSRPTVTSTPTAPAPTAPLTTPPAPVPTTVPVPSTTPPAPVPTATSVPTSTPPAPFPTTATTTATPAITLPPLGQHVWQHNEYSKMSECRPMAMNRNATLLCDPVVRASDGTVTSKPRINNGALVVPLSPVSGKNTYKDMYPVILGDGEHTIGVVSMNGDTPAPLLTRWDNSGSVVGELLDVPGWTPADKSDAWPLSVNAAGDVLVVSHSGSLRDEKAAVWKANGSVVLVDGPTPASVLEARQITDQGDVFGTDWSPDGRRMVVWRASTGLWQWLPTLPGYPNGEFVAASPDGLTVAANVWPDGAPRVVTKPVRIQGGKAVDVSAGGFGRFGVTTVLNDGTALSHAADPGENYPSHLVTPLLGVNRVDELIPHAADEITGTYAIDATGRILGFSRHALDAPNTPGSRVKFGLLHP